MLSIYNYVVSAIWKGVVFPFGVGGVVAKMIVVSEITGRYTENVNCLPSGNKYRSLILDNFFGDYKYVLV